MIRAHTGAKVAIQSGGQSEVIMDQGIDPKIGPGHLWFALAKPNGFGAP